jgi:hypothetical protein
MGQLPVTAVSRGPVRGRSNPGGAHRATRNAAIEKSLAAYFRLACGHLTVREEQERLSVFRPDRGKFWCEKCSRWLKLLPKNKPEPLPDEPLF